MNIIQQIESDVADAMKQHEEVRLSTLRLVRAAIKNQEIEQRAKGDVDLAQLAIAVLKRHVKQTQEAIEDFKKGNRTDLVARAEQEIAVMQSYLPAELSDAEISVIVDDVFAGLGDTPHQGKAIGEVMKKIAGRADGARVRNLVELRLKKV
ncbi:MAG: hypothetical protein A2848_00015 [Candidatus Magasanikbacteria bacterium RIFCSPHIGHO2_01_FULL_50_8]|uniref:Glutamyl-tRNA amidotransferase n=2 Tax=Candidatus Magasanikiibacteriota TaxID=1752731 RepID=A0A1F6LRA3_9BACT|nr:MAG: hypothetical protein A2848_00015 [Candidatus Magasanikbacteria bacterium RIFCSPHIGHO2_01_FULL_50_8]OGH68005.1 MAG: hypothetical protein A3C15_01150 [Candidatus Magasanikbacteria bacterium RIFCSPHIGHO2_02_FULL_50_9b]